MWCSTMSTLRPLSPVRPRITVDQLRHVLGADPGHRLVEQQHRRLAGQQQRDLELALLAVGQRAGQRVAAVGEADPVQHRVGLARPPPGPPRRAATARIEPPRRACTASRTFSAHASATPKTDEDWKVRPEPAPGPPVRGEPR